MKLTLLLSMAILAAGLPLASASTPNSQSDIRVLPPSALPEPAQQPSHDLLLYSGTAGTSYLYLEQNQGSRLVILDVTEPAHIRLTAIVETGIAKAYDFVQPVAWAYELIRFRDGSGSALLNLQKPKVPRIENFEQAAIEPIKMLGDSGYLAVALDKSVQPIQLVERDVQVVTSGAPPHLLAMVNGVTRTAELQETGTVFLLGTQGVTVVRRLDKEPQHAIQQLIANHN